MSQRWVKLPDGSYINAAKIVFVSKIERIPNQMDLEDDGQGDGSEPLYTVVIGTSLQSEQQHRLVGSKAEITTVAKHILKGQSDD